MSVWIVTKWDHDDGSGIDKVFASESDAEAYVESKEMKWFYDIEEHAVQPVQE